jgi:DNA-binding transcriptional MerR regulator
MAQDSRPIYSIGAVARLLGLTPATIRTWEDRYGIIAPKRSAGGHRLYSREEVERLRFVKMKTDEGIQPADAHRLLAERAGADADLTRGARQGGVRPLVLLAERDTYSVDVMDHFLRREGYDVEVAADPADAERKFAALAPQLAIVELLLSGGEGMDLCRRLKERGAAPVLAVSALDVGDAALAAGADAFLRKPLDPLVLVSTVKDLLGSPAFVEADAGRARE